ncbi:energy transducer TonB [Sphingomonas mesophila]|uniref:energy transducer TonB n=1 Tax=Sphingomonas mesophila TaxID=2303576 RepID=UPI000E59857A|nr:energy transducer TonB [Sphingomonas mesophila]
MIGDRDNRGGRHVGRVVVELGIAASGQVNACRLVESSGNPATDDLTCRLSYRILFRPARLASGQPVPDHTFYVVNWRGR